MDKMKKVEQEIGSGDSAIKKTVKNMWRLINRDLTSQIVLSKAKQLKGKDELQTLRKVFDYVINNFQYRSDPPGIEHFTAPKHLIAGRFKKYLDCDDLVGILAVLLLANKVPVRLKTIAWRRFEYTHIILEAKYKNMWIPLDPVQKSKGFGDQIRKVIREKIYENPMGKLITLEDDDNTLSGCCGGRKRRRVRDDHNHNSNVIMIGNNAEGLMYPRSVALPPGVSPPAKPLPAPKPPVAPKVEYRNKIKYIPYPVHKKAFKQPYRFISNQPVVRYREFY